MALDVPVTTKGALVVLFAIGVLVLMVGTVSGGGFLLGVILLAVALYILYIVGRRIHDRLINGSRRVRE